MPYKLTIFLSFFRHFQIAVRSLDLTLAENHKFCLNIDSPLFPLSLLPSVGAHSSYLSSFIIIMATNAFLITSFINKEKVDVSSLNNRLLFYFLPFNTSFDIFLKCMFSFIFFLSTVCDLLITLNI